MAAKTAGTTNLTISWSTLTHSSADVGQLRDSGNQQLELSCCWRLWPYKVTLRGSARGMLLIGDSGKWMETCLHCELRLMCFETFKQLPALGGTADSYSLGFLGSVDSERYFKLSLPFLRGQWDRWFPRPRKCLPQKGHGLKKISK